tara:strand:- start:1223 stop:1471 length:249 start_codon:yes stop_codon:yes gene_type:complete
MRLLHLFNELPLLKLVPFPVALSRLFEGLYRPVLSASTPYFVLPDSPLVCLEFGGDTPVIEICVFYRFAYKLLYSINLQFCA